MKTKNGFQEKSFHLETFWFSGNGGFLKLLTTDCRKKESFLLETS